MDKELVLRKLESLRRCLDRISQKTPSSPETLQKDLDLQDIIVVNLERAVQVCVDLGTHLLASQKAVVPKTMSDVFYQLAEIGIITASTSDLMVKTVGFRNVAVHEYDTLDWNIVYSLITKNLRVFRDFSQEVLKN